MYVSKEVLLCSHELVGHIFLGSCMEQGVSREPDMYLILYVLSLERLKDRGLL